MIGSVNRARAVLTALVLALALGLVGCSDNDPEPRTAPPSVELTPSPSAPTSSAPAAPVMPEAAKGTDAAAAEAFVKFYWDTVNYAQATGDLDDLRELSAEECAACRGGLDYLEKVFSKDGHIVGGDNEVAGIEIVGFVKHRGRYSDAVVNLTLRTTPQSVEFPGTSKDERYAGGKSTLEMRVRLLPDERRVISWSRT